MSGVRSVPMRVTPGTLDDALLSDCSMSHGFGDDDVLYGVAASNWELRMKWPWFSRVEFIVESSWLKPGAFFAFKVAAWMWSMAIWLMTLSKSHPQGKFFAFLTNWNQSLLLLYFSLSLYVCARHWHGRDIALPSSVYSQPAAGQSLRAPVSSYHPSQGLIRWIYWNCQHSFAWTVLVVLMYWSTEFPHSLSEGTPTRYELFSSVSVHGVTLVLISCDLWLNRVEFVFAHLAYTLPLSALYVLTNLAYVKAGGGYLYEILKWKDWVSGVTVVGCLAFIALGLWPLGNIVCRLRNRASGNRSPIAHEPFCTCK